MRFTLKTTALCGLVILSAVAAAQSAPIWTAVYNGAANGVDGGPKIARDGAGNTFVAAFETGSWDDIVTIKYGPGGQQLWSRSWSGSGWGKDTPADLAVDGDGNVVVVGTSWNGLNPQGTEFDLIVLKYDPAGTLVWERRYDSIGWSEDASSVKIDAQGNVYVGGTTTNRAANQLLHPDWIVLKYSPAGELLWSRVHAGAGAESDVLDRLALDAAGNVYATGTSGAFRDNDWVNDLTTIKYSATGQKLWEARNEGVPGMRTNGNIPRSIEIDAQGNAYVAGWAPLGDNGRNALLLKYSPAGQELWKRVWGHNLEDVVYHMTLDAQGNAFVAVNHEPVPGVGYPDSDAVLLKYAPNGNLLWERFYSGPAQLWDGDSVVATDASGNAYMGIQSQDATFGYKVLKYSPAGQLLWVWRFDNPNGEGSMFADLTLGPDGVLRLTGETWHDGQSRNVLTAAVAVDQVVGYAPASILEAKLSPNMAAAGAGSTLTVTLDRPAPTGGAAVRLRSGNTNHISLPGFLVIKAGQQTGSVMFGTNSFAGTQAVSVEASYNFQMHRDVMHLGNFQRVTPATYAIESGAHLSGGVGSLSASDDERLAVNTTHFNLPIAIRFEATAPVQTPSTLTFRYEGHVNNPSSIQQLELYDFAAGSWVVVDSRPGSASDVQVVVAPTNPARFVQSGTRLVRARVSVSSGSRNMRSWQTRVDFVSWTMAP
jgi:hypothetical protein